MFVFPPKVNEAVDVDAVGSPERNLRNINAKTFLEGFEAVVFAIDELSDEDKEKLCLRTLIDGNHPVLSKLFIFVSLLCPYFILFPRSLFHSLSSFSLCIQSSCCIRQQLNFAFFPFHLDSRLNARIN